MEELIEEIAKAFIPAIMEECKTGDGKGVCKPNQDNIFIKSFDPMGITIGSNLNEFLANLSKLNTSGDCVENTCNPNIANIFNTSKKAKSNQGFPILKQQFKKEDDDVFNKFGSLDIREMETYVSFIFDLPGVKKESINLSISHDDCLFLKVDRQLYSNSSDIFIKKERFNGPIQRKVPLPKVSLDKNSISAKYEDGVLYVRLNKLNESVHYQKVAIA